MASCFNLLLTLTLSAVCLQGSSNALISHRIVRNRVGCDFKSSLCLPSSIIVFANLFLPISYFYSIF